MDTLYVMGVMSTILIKLAVFHYAWCEGMKDVFKLSSHRIVALSGGLFVWAGSIAYFQSDSDVTHFVSSVAPAYCTGDFLEANVKDVETEHAGATEPAFDIMVNGKANPLKISKHWGRPLTTCGLLEEQEE